MELPTAKRAKTTETPAPASSAGQTMTWSTEQQMAIDAVMSGRNVFLTGPGGVGKSAVIPYIVEQLKTRYRKRVCITATTGVAAIALGGTTLHGFAGVGLADAPVNVCIAKANNNTQVRRRWQETDVLIIDEVSMLNADFFEKLSRIARALRYRPNAPFGNMQLILSGDFLQLPPVSVRERPPAGGPANNNDRVAFVQTVTPLFESDAWNSLDLLYVKMEKSFRQEDLAFVALLNRARYGALTAEDAALLASRVNAKLDVAPGIIPTKLYSRSANVETENANQLEKCALPEHVYVASYYDRLGKRPADSVPGQIVDSFIADRRLKLRVGAQVMLLANLDVPAGLANGSRGVVVGFEVAPISIDDDEDDKGGIKPMKSRPLDVGLDGASVYPIVQFCNGTKRLITPHEWDRTQPDGEVVWCRQVPLKLAWAITIHKSQGCSLDCGVASIDNNVFEYGQAYVALSRFRNLEGMCLSAFQPEVVRANPAVVQFYKNMQ